MIENFCMFDDSDLEAIVHAVRSGRLLPPFSTFGLGRIVASDRAEGLASALGSLAGLGLTPTAIVHVIELLLADRRQHRSIDDAIQLVTSGPDSTATARDTAIVVRDLFAYAERSVWIAGYAVHGGKKVFSSLAERMTTQPQLHAVLILDVRRGPGDTSSNASIIKRFVDHFRQKEWPEGTPLPRAYYFPKAMETNNSLRAALHAKCVVVDSRVCFVSSANFTSAAQNKNVEIGLQVNSSVVANRLQRYLETMVEVGTLLPLW